MKALLQRVSHASVRVNDAVVGEIGAGLLVFVGLDKGDDQATANRLLDKLLAYRVFADEAGRMNRSVSDIEGVCCWYPNSPCLLTPAKACDRASLLLSHLPSRSPCTIIC